LEGALAARPAHLKWPTNRSYHCCESGEHKPGQHFAPESIGEHDRIALDAAHDGFARIAYDISNRSGASPASVRARCARFLSMPASERVGFSETFPP
jgi:hypothetical protein